MRRDGVCRCHSVATVAPANTIGGEGQGVISTLAPAKGERAEAALLPKNPAPSLLAAAETHLWLLATAQGVSGHREQGAVLWASKPSSSTDHIPLYSASAPRPRQPKMRTPPTLAPRYCMHRLEKTQPALQHHLLENRRASSRHQSPACSLLGSHLPEQEKNSDFHCTSQGMTH